MRDSNLRAASLQVLTLPETRHNVLLMRRAKKLRKDTGNNRIVAPHEPERNEPGRLWKVSLMRPVKFLFTEPITVGAFSLEEFTSWRAAERSFLVLVCHLQCKSGSR